MDDNYAIKQMARIKHIKERTKKRSEREFQTVHQESGRGSGRVHPVFFDYEKDLAKNSDSQPSVTISTSKRSLKNKMLDSMKDSSFQQDSSMSAGATQSTNRMPKMKMLDRSKLMDLMLFPQNCKKMVIVPSNKEGTGFLNHCYDKDFLK